ncbi:hypothetical protein AMAG_00410 [Allomyces macrogynus ATCC 38327]|uniref:Uncharacterized protein n=1 Tax=Allomyces macrogynus (strain ATCC 38327) TaxID=578462 RepID=A0A0L0RWH8_ALLM3|nr:hypothetical protein AMAG_00410 [Allomyces macrogynus ATCC 38327]|eukprot:KNE54436.1 hypothetical protein AMAG_00410 [Allomyces macrogynus ATCC 38327]
MRAEVATLVKHRNAPGFPFKFKAYIAYQYPAMASDRDKVDLLEELVVQHMPSQHSHSPNATRMALVLLRYATVDEWDWVNMVMQRHILAHLDELVRATLGDVDSPDRDGVPLLLLFVLNDPPTNYEQQQRRRYDAFIPFWTTNLSSLRYLWMRDVPTEVLNLVRDYATLLADARLLDAIRDGHIEAIKGTLADAPAAATRDVQHSP